MKSEKVKQREKERLIISKRGKFIAELRQEKGLTQGELGELLHFDHTTVSKWERGISFPLDPDVVISLAELLGVSFEELLYGERRDNKNEKEIQDKIGDEYSSNYQKYKRRIYKLIYILLLFIVFFFITIYFVFIRKSIFVYSINLESGNIKIENSNLVISNYLSILNFNKIIELNDKKIESVKLYYLTDSDEERLVFSGDNKNHYIEEQNGYEEYNLQELPNVRLYVEVRFEDGDKEEYQLYLEEKYTNDNIFPKKVDKISEETTKKVLDIDEDEVERILLAEGFEYNGMSFEKEFEDGGNISVDIKNNNVIRYFGVQYVLDSNLDDDEVWYISLRDNNDVIFAVSKEINCNEKKCKTAEDFAGYIKFIKELLK